MAMIWSQDAVETVFRAEQAGSGYHPGPKCEKMGGCTYIGTGRIRLGGPGAFAGHISPCQWP